MNLSTDFEGARVAAGQYYYTIMTVVSRHLYLHIGRLDGYLRGRGRIRASVLDGTSNMYIYDSLPN